MRLLFRAPNAEGRVIDGAAAPRHCDVCYALPRHRYGVRDEQGKLVWEGGCRECAHKIAHGHDGWTVVPVDMPARRLGRRHGKA